MKNENNETLTLDAYDFISFLQKAEEALKEGWSFDYSTNSTAPQNLGFRYFAVLTKNSKPTAKNASTPAAAPTPAEKEDTKEQTVKQEEQKGQEDKAQTQRGRKPNSAK